MIGKPRTLACAIIILGALAASAQEVVPPPLMNRQQQRGAARERAAQFNAAFQEITVDLIDGFIGAACGQRSLDWWHEKEQAILARAGAIARARMHFAPAAEAYIDATAASAHLAAIRMMGDFGDLPCVRLVSENRLERLESRAGNR